MSPLMVIAQRSIFNALNRVLVRARFLRARPISRLFSVSEYVDVGLLIPEGFIYGL